LEHILLFSKSPNPSWDIDRLPRRPAAARSAQKAEKDAQRSAATRPSGYDINPTAFTGGKDGSLPGNLIVAGSASGNDVYS
ncbi:hypothetical protein, partial [Streptococcus pneumoniae]|uniref:hypothetical protein n=1 Tax=Streptococcus pneumoniae TaxID=1313 RepID=UPI0019537E46